MPSKAQAALNVVVSIGPKASAYTGTPITVTGSTTSASPAVASVSSTAGLLPGMPISGTGIAAGTTILTVGGGTLTLSKNATATGSGVTLTINPFVLLGEVSSSPDKSAWDKEEVTSFDSGTTKEFIKTLKDPGTIDLEFNRVSDNGGQMSLKAAEADPSAYMFQIQLPQNVDQTTAGDSFIFAALVMDVSNTVQIGKAIKTKCTLQRTGAVTFTAGS